MKTIKSPKLPAIPDHSHIYEGGYFDQNKGGISDIKDDHPSNGSEYSKPPAQTLPPKRGRNE